MSGPNERDEIAAVLAKALYEHSAASTFDATCGTCARERNRALALAERLLASDWLAERDRRTAATAIREAADWMNSAEFKQPEASRYINESHWDDAIVDACDALELRARRIEADQ